MKKIVLLMVILTIVFKSFGQDKFCDPAILDEVNNYPMKDGATWLKDFTVHYSSNESPKYSVLLTKRTRYRFVIENSSKFKGKMRFSIIDPSNTVLLSKTFDNDSKPFDVDFNALVTCQYHIVFSPENKEDGCAALAIYYVKEITKLIDEPFTKNFATFQGEDRITFLDYVDKNLKYPKDAILDKDLLLIWVEFKLDANGKPTNIVAKNSENYKPFADEAIRVVNSSPSWEKGAFSNENDIITIPVVFRKQ